MYFFGQLTTYVLHSHIETKLSCAVLHLLLRAFWLDESNRFL